MWLVNAFKQNCGLLSYPCGLMSLWAFVLHSCRTPYRTDMWLAIIQHTVYLNKAWLQMSELSALSGKWSIGPWWGRKMKRPCPPPTRNILYGIPCIHCYSFEYQSSMSSLFVVSLYFPFVRFSQVCLNVDHQWDAAVRSAWQTLFDWHSSFVTMSPAVCSLMLRQH